MAAYGSVIRWDGQRQSPERLEELKGLRTALYGCATRRADAWFELVDALLVTERLVSLPHLSLEPVHRRGHGSLYAALWWAGLPGIAPELALVWRAYVRRFDIEHTIRFWKQTLHWTLPRPRTPEQADRFTWAVAAGHGARQPL